MKSMHLLVALTSLFTAQLAVAHTLWLEPAGDTDNGWKVMFGGHAGKLEPLDASKIESVETFDAGGRKLDYQREDNGDDVVLRFPDDAVLAAIYFDNGIWTRDRMGRSVNSPMTEVEGATEATHAVKYHKTILDWTDFVMQPLGQTFEVTPLVGEQPAAGEPMRVRVTLHGEPLAGVSLGHGEEGDAGMTDDNGIATFVPTAGFNKLWAGKRFAVDDASEYTELSYEYLFGFEAAE
jgi:nickel transport protein